MLRKENRLSGNAILAVLKRSRRINFDGFAISYSMNGMPVSRCAFVISRKVDARATERNKIKRKLSAVWQKFIKNKMVEGIDVVVLVKPTRGLIDTTVLAKNLERVLETILGSEKSANKEGTNPNIKNNSVN